MPSKPLNPADCCPKCPVDDPAVHPYSVVEDEDGDGVVARYRCPRGHSWYTSWGYALLLGYPEDPFIY